MEAPTFDSVKQGITRLCLIDHIAGLEDSLATMLDTSARIGLLDNGSPQIERVKAIIGNMITEQERKIQVSKGVLG